MAAQIIKNVRFCNLIDTYANWTDGDQKHILREGELGIVRLGINDRTVGIIGDGATDIRDFLNQPIGYEDNIIYFGRGAQMPAATGDQLGGVKNGPIETAIEIKNGIIYNKLVDSWDSNAGQYVIKKLKIEDLTCDNFQADLSIEGDVLLLRKKQEGALEDGVISGIEIDKLIQKEDGSFYKGYFGLDNKENFYISRQGSNLPLYPAENVYYNNTIGFYNFNAENQAFSILPPKELIFKNDYWATGEPTDEKYEETKLKKYDGIMSGFEINLTPPTITTANGNAEYDFETNTYTLLLNGGLSDENIELLNSIKPALERVDACEEAVANNNTNIETLQTNVENLQTTKLESKDIIIESGNKITVTRTEGTTTFSVAHNTATVTTDSDTEEIITKGQSYTFITGIETDNYGHITKIITSTYKWN